MPRAPEGIAPPRQGSRRQRSWRSPARPAGLATSSSLILPRPRGLPALVPGIRPPEDDDETGPLSAEEATLALARSLARLGIADFSDWRRAGHSPWNLIQSVLHRWVTSHRAAEVAEQFNLEAKLVQSLDSLYGYSWRPGHLRSGGRVYLVVEAELSAYTVLGPAIRRLHQAHPALPATFFDHFVDSVGRWLPIYDYRAAEERLEREREWMDEAMDEEEKEDVELADLSKCIPPCLRVPVLSDRELKRILRRVTDPTALELMRAAQRVRRHAVHVEVPPWYEEVQYFDLTDPLPALLAVTEQYDEIQGMYDREMEERFNWGVQMGPSAVFQMDPYDPASVGCAFDLLAGLCETLAEASHLISTLEVLHKTEHRHAD